MFQMSKYTSLLGFQKLSYIADLAEIREDEIAEAVEENSSTVKCILEKGLVPPDIPNANIIFEKLYLLRMLFSSLLSLSQYSEEGVKHLLSDTEEFQQCITPPPWYPQNLRDYIVKGKNEAVSKALHWLSTY